MEEDKDLEMNLFDDDNFEFNFDDFPQDEDESNEDDENINDAVEDEGSEEVDGDEDVKEDGTDDEDDNSDSSSNLYSSLAALIYEQGLLPSLDIENTKITNVDEFVTAFKNESLAQAQILADEYINNIDVDSIVRSKAEINDLNNITEDYLKDNPEVAKQIIYQDYLNQGLDEKKATRLLNRLIDLGEDAILEDAVDSISSLKEFNNRRIEAAKAEYEENIRVEKERQEQYEKVIKQTIFDRKDLINGFTPNKAVQDKVYKSMNEIVGKSPIDGSFENKFMKDRRENPIEFEARMYYFYELTNGFKDYNKVATSAKSKAVNDLEKIVKKGAYKDAGTPAWMVDKNSYDIGIGDELNL